MNDAKLKQHLLSVFRKVKQNPKKYTGWDSVNINTEIGLIALTDDVMSEILSGNITLQFVYNGRAYHMNLNL